jgi:hypothetical protein
MQCVASSLAAGCSAVVSLEWVVGVLELGGGGVGHWVQERENLDPPMCIKCGQS